MNNILMYCHNGSGNHGCEAIIRSTVNILSREGAWQYYLISRDVEEDRNYGVDELVELLPEFSEVKTDSHGFLRAYLRQKLFNDSTSMDYMSSEVAFKIPQGNTVSLSIGGDNYCYKGYKLYIKYHQLSKKMGHKTVLWGCSVEPDFLENEDLLSDLRTFDKILVRESISYEAMRAKGLKNIVLYPDPAFTLEQDVMSKYLPPENTVGINISPMIMQYASENSKIIENYKELINYIITETSMNVALIPHVVWPYNDDRESLKGLKEFFKDEPRVFLVEDMNCTSLKAYIAQLRALVGARTHATIAAYSTCVPTLVVGYSVKSRGIARDIFGSEEHFVIPVNQMTDTLQLTEAFKWIIKRENIIREHLHKIMPEYIEKSFQAGNEIARYLELKDDYKLKTGLNKYNCVGCEACVNICPMSALKMTSDSEGFAYPECNSDLCVNCMKCAKICPVVNNKIERHFKDCYAIKNRDLDVRYSSSSGGVFSALCEEILLKGGVVFGAGFDNDLSIRHFEVTDIKQLDILRGAKYSQSKMGNSYAQVKQQLDDGKYVLFSGTPCQVAALRSFLGQDYEKLICVDIICHGIPSPLVWKRYLEQLFPKKLPQKVNFRSKETGWSHYRYSLSFYNDDGTNVSNLSQNDAFLQGMVHNLYLRPSCSACHFKGSFHPGDITLGDFWGIWNVDQAFDDDNGVSAVIVNTAKGQNLLDICKAKLDIKSVCIEDIKKENTSWARSSFSNAKRIDFFEGLNRGQNIVTLVDQLIVNNDVKQRNYIDFLISIKHVLFRSK